MRDPDVTDDAPAPFAIPKAPTGREIAQNLARLLADWGAGDAASLHELIASEMDFLSVERIAELLDRVAHCGEGWGYHPPDPFVRWLSREIMGRVVTGGTLSNGSALEVARSRPVILVGNHLSFIDANVFDFFCARAGYTDVVDRLTTIVGPKVYTELIRKLASLCFGTVKIAQSQSIASGEAVMSPREVARIVRQTLNVAHERVAVGDHLLIFPEGSRSRSASLQRMLPAVARYMAKEVVILPWGITGAQHLDPIDDDYVHPSPVDIRLGPPVEASELIARCQEKRGLIMDAVGFLIAATLPESYRGVYGGPEADVASDGLERAQEIALALAP